MNKKEKERWTEFIRSLHPADLHRHLDGSIRPSTLWALSEKYYKAIPGMNFAGFEGMLRYDPDRDRTLLHYLDKFHVPLQYTQFYDNIQTIAFEIAEDAYSEGIRVLEVRVNPVIHRRAGLTTRQVITAILSGFKLSMERHPDYAIGLIVIAMRNHGGNMAKILLREITGEKEAYHSGPGVVGFDIAGAERPFPPVLFREAYELAGRMGLKRTVHVGEDGGPDKVWQAVDILRPERLGHAVSAGKDKELLRRLARDNILVEVCLTSNLQTGAVSDLRDHPLPVFLEHDVPCTLCTDNPTVSSTDLIKEYLLAIETFGFEEEEVRHLVMTGLKHRFMNG